MGSFKQWGAGGSEAWLTLILLQRVTVTENKAMTRGCKPQGEHALSNAERQARYRARHQAAAAKAVTRPHRLQNSATADALEAIVDVDLTLLADIEPPRGSGRD